MAFWDELKSWFYKIVQMRLYAVSGDQVTCQHHYTWYLFWDIFRWHPDLYGKSGISSRQGCALSPKTALKTWPLHKCKKVPILQRWGIILRICYFGLRHQNKRTKDPYCRNLAGAKISLTYSDIFKLCKFL